MKSTKFFLLCTEPVVWLNYAVVDFVLLGWLLYASLPNSNGCRTAENEAVDSLLWSRFVKMIKVCPVFSMG